MNEEGHKKKAEEIESALNELPQILKVNT